MFSKLGDWFRNFMMGRYGSDQLNVALLAAGIVMMILGAILGRSFGWASALNFLCYVPLVWCIFRMYSRNIAARRRENRRALTASPESGAAKATCIKKNSGRSPTIPHSESSLSSPGKPATSPFADSFSGSDDRWPPLFCPELFHNSPGPAEEVRICGRRHWEPG